MPVSVEIRLDICEPEGRTWLARITGADDQGRPARQLIKPVERQTSRSNKTGHAVYAVGPGVYERHEGRRRLRDRNGFFVIDMLGRTSRLPSAEAALDHLQARNRPPQ